MVNQGDYSLRHDVDRLQNKVNVFENTFTSSFFIECSVPAIFYKDNTFNPTSITFYSYTENKGKTELYKGLLKILTSVDGNTYTELKTSTDSSTTINLSDNTIKYIKCQLYDTTNQLLDTQTIPVLKDGVEGKDGSSPISLFLGNESQLIPCTSEGLVQDTISFTIPFYCYKGTLLYPCNYTPPSNNPFTNLGFGYKLDKQCSSTDNGQITITATKDTNLRGLRTSNIQLDFLVDGATVTKEFTWAKVIKGADGKSGTDGETPVMYVKYSETETPLGMDELKDTETEGYDYQGIAWVYDGVEPTTVSAYEPFVKYNAKDGTPAQRGFVHFAYGNIGADGQITDFSTTESKNRTHIGTLYDFKGQDSENIEEYTWAKIKGETGADGVTPTSEDIQNVINDSKLDAVTLDGNGPDSFIPAQIPVTTIYRDSSSSEEKGKNYVEIYQLGQLVICQVQKFSGDSTNNYGEYDSNYFRLMPESKDKEFPEKLRPPMGQSLYINDLNKATGESNGRLRLVNTGEGVCVCKLGTPGTSYNNSFGTFIYPIIPRTNTVISLDEVSSYSFGSNYNLTLKDSNGNLLADKPVRFTIDGNNYTYYTNSNGVVSCPLPTAGDKKTITANFFGDKSYNPSSYTGSATISKVKISYNYSGGTGSASSYTLTGNTLTVQVIYNNGYALSNWKVYVNNTIYTTDSNGKIYINNPTAGSTYTVRLVSGSCCFSNYSDSVSVTIASTPTPTSYTDVKVPQNAVGSSTNGAIKAYDNTNISLVQTLNNIPSDSIQCYHNGSGNSLRVTPAPIYFNCFQIPARGKDCDVTAKVLVGEFNGITGGNMAYPTVQILDVSTGTVYGTSPATTNSFGAGDKDTFRQINATATIPADLIYSDNLAVKIIPARSYLTTTTSYNKSYFRINYVEITATTK